jgi:methionyl-tRNA formyltransferase
MNKIPIIFIGTGGIGVPLLEKLAQDERFEVRLVVTQVDKPAGRKMSLTASPIKVKTSELGLPVFQPEDINSAESLARIREIDPDMIVLMAYGQILGGELLGIPEFGCINVHASLLPKYRGASPIQQCLLERKDVTGISIMQMVEAMDAGPVFKLADLDIASDDNALTLTDRLAQLTAYETPDALFMMASGDLEATAQDETTATYCKKIQKSDGQINWSENGQVILAKIRAYAGWPGTFTFWSEKRLKILNGRYDEFSEGGEAGQVFEKDHIIMVGCGKGSIVLDKVQLEGKTVQSIDMFIKGYTDFVGAKL